MEKPEKLNIANESEKLERDAVIAGQIEELDFFGQGILHWQGRCVFVEDALPGETAEVRIGKVKKKFAFGKAAHILNPSPQRLTPPCPHYGQCGGCQFQHVDYEMEIAAKTAHLQHVLRRIGGIVELPEIEVLPTPSLYEYRQKVTWQVRQGRFGYYAGKNREFLPIDSCLLLDPVLTKLTHRLRSVDIPGLEQAVLRCNDGGEAFLLLHGGIRDRSEIAADIMAAAPGLLGISFVNPAGKVYTKGAKRFSQSLGDFTFRVDPQSFFQINAKAAAALMAAVRRRIKPGGRLLDLYCGTGAWGICLNDRFDAVYGLDVVGQAVEDARFNAAANRVFGGYRQGKAEDKLEQWWQDMPPIDTVLVDPPRQGLFPGVPESLVAAGPRQIVYASCDPATLARDLSILCADAYQITDLIAADLFPRTAHVECVVLMSRVKE